PTFIHLPGDTRCSVSVVTSEKQWWCFHLMRRGGDVSYCAKSRRALRFRKRLFSKPKTHYSRTLVKQMFSSLFLFPVSFTLPEQGEHLDEVMFVELSSDEALKLLTHYKEEARRLLPTPPKRKKHRQGSQNRPIH
ncbi:hypothetical protein M9458_027909, partial [Cirrhinus mrigala]